MPDCIHQFLPEANSHAPQRASGHADYNCLYWKNSLGSDLTLRLQSQPLWYLAHCHNWTSQWFLSLMSQTSTWINMLLGAFPFLRPAVSLGLLMHYRRGHQINTECIITWHAFMRQGKNSISWDFRQGAQHQQAGGENIINEALSLSFLITLDEVSWVWRIC